MATSSRVNGEQNLDTLLTMSSLEGTFWNQGRWKKAEELQRHVKESLLPVLGQEHPDTLRAMGNLAATFREQGPVKSTVPSVRDHCGRGRTAKWPSVQGQDGNGAVFLRQDGDGRQ